MTARLLIASSVVWMLAIALRRLDSQAPAAQVAGMHRIAARLRHFERLLEDVTAGQLTNVAEDLVIEARHPRDLGALLRAQARWLLRFSSRPDRFMAARGISDFTQFPTSAGRYSFTSQWHGVVDRCDVTVAAGSLSGAPEFGNDRSTTGVVLTDSFAGCPANTGVPLKHRSGQGRGWLRPHSGALRIVRDHGSWLEIAAAHGRAFKLSLVSGRLTAIRRRP